MRMLFKLFLYLFDNWKFIIPILTFGGQDKTSSEFYHGLFCTSKQTYSSPKYTLFYPLQILAPDLWSAQIFPTQVAGQLYTFYNIFNTNPSSSQNTIVKLEQADKTMRNCCCPVGIGNDYLQQMEKFYNLKNLRMYTVPGNWKHHYYL